MRERSLILKQIILEHMSLIFILISLSSSFHLAAAKGDVPCVNAMLSHGVDVTAIDAAGNSSHWHRGQSIRLRLKLPLLR